MELTNEQLNILLDENHITYDHFELTQMMVIKDMLRRVLIEYYSIGYEDGKNNV